jgi:hypothetical protein
MSAVGRTRPSAEHQVIRAKKVQTVTYGKNLPETNLAEFSFAWHVVSSLWAVQLGLLFEVPSPCYRGSKTVN